MQARSRTVAGPQPTVIELSDRQQRILKHLLRRQTSTQRLVRRVNIILTAADGSNNEQIAKRFGLHRESVRHWRERWLSVAAGLAAVEAQESDEKSLTEAIEAVLPDAYRSGAPSCQHQAGMSANHQFEMSPDHHRKCPLTGADRRRRGWGQVGNLQRSEELSTCPSAQALSDQSGLVTSSSVSERGLARPRSPARRFSFRR